jgi:hypothetical protein
MEIKGWKFKEISSGGTMSFEDNRGIKYNSSIMSNTDKIIIHKNGTTRFLKFPTFVIDYVEEMTRKQLNNNNLIVINKRK